MNTRDFHYYVARVPMDRRVKQVRDEIESCRRGDAGKELGRTMCLIAWAAEAGRR